MAKTYGHHPNIIYEIFNEPDHETWNEVKSYSTDTTPDVADYNWSVAVGYESNVFPIEVYMQ